MSSSILKNHSITKIAIPRTLVLKSLLEIVFKHSAYHPLTPILIRNCADPSEYRCLQYNESLSPCAVLSCFKKKKFFTPVGEKFLDFMTTAAAHISVMISAEVHSSQLSQEHLQPNLRPISFCLPCNRSLDVALSWLIYCSAMIL